MKRHWSQIDGLPLTGEHHSRPLALVTGIFIDPECGKILAFKASFKRVVSPLDIEAWRATQLELSGPDALTLPEEISRLQRFSSRRMNLLGKRVCTKSGKSLGRIRDFCLDTATASLLTLDVSRRFLWWEWDLRTYSFSDIQEVTDNEVILKIEPEQKAKAKEKIPAKEAVRLSTASSFEGHS